MTKSKAEVELLVCGAHMSGLPLNYQLSQLGASLVGGVVSSANYRLFDLTEWSARRLGGDFKGEVIAKPGLVRAYGPGGAYSIELELWKVPSERWGELMVQVPYPLALGRIELDDGRWLVGFVCDAGVVELGAVVEISQYGGWRNYLRREV